MENRVSNRVSSVEGVRGLAALIVFLHHFILLFYPAVFWSQNDTLCNEIDVIIGQTPLGFFFAGNSAVMVFLMLTGFGTYFMTATVDVDKKTKFWMLRFAKMFIMIWTSTLYVWIALKCNFAYGREVSLMTKSPWLEEFGPMEMNLIKLLRQSVFSVGNMYNSTLWTMYFIFEASFIALLTYSLVKEKKRALVYIFFVLLTFICLHTLYLIPAVMGCFLAELYLKRSQYEIGNRAGILILIISVFLWSYPSNVRNGYMYEVLPKAFAEGYHMIGALLFIVLACYWRPIKKCMESRFLQKLAKYSMPIYILHFGILISFSAFCYKKLIVCFEHNVATFITFMGTIFALGIMVWLYNKVIGFLYRKMDELCMKIIHIVDGKQ